MQITADSIGVYTKVFSLSPYQNFDVIRQWSVQWCLMSGPSCLYVKMSYMETSSIKVSLKGRLLDVKYYVKMSYMETLSIKVSLKGRAIRYPKEGM